MAVSGSKWFALNVAAAGAACCGALFVAFGGLPGITERGATWWPLVTFPLLVSLALARQKPYRRTRAILADDLPRMAATVSTTMATMVAICLVTTGSVRGPTLFAKMWLFALLGVLGLYVALESIRRAIRSHSPGEPVVIVGAGNVGAAIARRLLGDPGYGLAPVGFVDDTSHSVSQTTPDVPLLGRLDHLRQILITTGARRVILAFSRAPDARIQNAVGQCEDLGIVVSIVPRMFESINDRITYEPLGALPLLSLSIVDPRSMRFGMKHALDRVISALMLVALSVPMLVIATMIRLSSPGPAVIRQQRVGRDGAVFDLLKFRTMHVDTRPVALFEPAAGLAPGGVEGMDRRTRIGRLLRRFSLDELPQLINVLKGEMSLVGPRPERPEFVALFERQIGRYRERHRVKSGITGLAQVNGLRGQTSLRERIDLDNYYIANWSLGLDLKIACLTLLWLFRSAE
jgi:exopolysaccharide biosynthesis polyprenyl glycosylphosphotransferase